MIYILLCVEDVCWGIFLVARHLGNVCANIKGESSKIIHCKSNKPNQPVTLFIIPTMSPEKWTVWHRECTKKGKILNLTVYIHLCKVYSTFSRYLCSSLQEKWGKKRHRKVKRQCCILKADRRLHFSLKTNTVDALPMTLITTTNYNIRIRCLTVTVEKSRNLHKVSVFILIINSTLKK